MWNDHFHLLPDVPQPRMSKSAPCSPLKPLLKRLPARADSFHVLHKVPVGDTPYVKAKHVQLVDKEPDRAIALFWAAINAGDRVDSALKDMAIVMKQQNRPEEAIEAIKSLRYRCSEQAQESLDNVLLDLYKRCGRLDDQIALLKHKLHLIHQGLAFNGRRTKTARSQGKKFQVSIEQEATRLLGNLGWAYMQQSNYVAAEAVYRKALSIEPDNNKVCNLGICLMKQGRLKEAKSMLRSVKPATNDNPWGLDSHLKSYERAQEMLRELESSRMSINEGESVWLPEDLDGRQPCPWRWNQNPLTDSDLSGALSATAGFGPAQKPPLHPAAPPPAPALYAKPCCRWDEDDAQHGFADENSSKNSARFDENQFTKQVRHKLEEMMIADHKELEQEEDGKLERSFSFPPLAPAASTLNSAALPFIAKAFHPQPKNRMPLTLDSANQLPNTTVAASDALHRLSSAADNNSSCAPSPPSSAIKKNCCKSLFSSAGDDGPDSSWSLLGFVQSQSSPLTTIAAAIAATDDKSSRTPEMVLRGVKQPLSLLLQHDKCQRRLQVFQEMTLPVSPQA